MPLLFSVFTLYRSVIDGNALAVLYPVRRDYPNIYYLISHFMKITVATYYFLILVYNMHPSLFTPPILFEAQGMNNHIYLNSLHCNN